MTHRSARLPVLQPICGALALASLLLCIGCEMFESRREPAPRHSVPEVPRRVPEQLGPVTRSPWTYDGRVGEQIETPHYRVFTTATSSIAAQRLPEFLEAALTHYRTGITGAASALPAPELKLDTFVMRSRSEWERLSRQLLADQAETFMNIQRGGFAYGGRALLFNIGPADTLAVASHEGWHQYTQRTFKSPLPIWLEEGIATHAEGHRWDAAGRSAIFLPWANTERFDQLRRAASTGRLMPLTELMSTSPQTLIKDSSNSEAGLTYYAQVWALAHYLNEGDGGKHRAQLRVLLHDAASGAVPAKLNASLLAMSPERSVRLRSTSAGVNAGPVVFMTYFNSDLNASSAAYERFVRQIIATGSRERITAGESPIIDVRGSDDLGGRSP